jgi:hypothetical protein
VQIDEAKGVFRARGREFKAGQIITIDGGKGEVLDGAVKMIEPELSGDFAKLMTWADKVRRLKVRANAETPLDARTARQFGAEGVGLCRTEHMFFEETRIAVVREMILADDEQGRRTALAKILPFQREDFVQLFTIMAGLPVTIRLLDPPLHEFLPHTEEELKALADTCRAQGTRIISDEIYHGLGYGAAMHTMLEFDDQAIVINSFSKYFSMVAWRLGWMVVPEAEIVHFRSYLANLFLTAPSLSQHAGLAAMDCTAELDGYVAVYAANRALMLEALPAMGLSAIAPPDGAFYIYADVGHLTEDSLGFCEQLVRDTGVATAPGIDFDPVDGGRFIRMSFAVSTPEIEEAIRRLIPWFQDKAVKTVQARETASA